jgi:hypothetical protein
MERTRIPRSIVELGFQANTGTHKEDLKDLA